MEPYRPRVASVFRGFCARTPLGGRIRCAASEAVGDPGFWDGLAIIGGQLDAAGEGRRTVVTAETRALDSVVNPESIRRCAGHTRPHTRPKRPLETKEVSIGT